MQIGRGGILRMISVQFRPVPGLSFTAVYLLFTASLDLFVPS